MRYKLNDSGLRNKIQTNLSGYRESVLFKPSRKRQQSILAGIPVLQCATHTLHDGPSLQIANATKMMEILRFSHTSIDPGLFLSRHGFSKSCEPYNSQPRYACNEYEPLPVFFFAATFLERRNLCLNGSYQFRWWKEFVQDDDFVRKRQVYQPIKGQDPKTSVTIASQL